MINNKLNLIMLVGLPASGKSTIATEIKDDFFKNNKVLNIHSSDEIREEILNDVNRQDKNNQIFEILHTRVISDLKKGVSVMYDATNISSKRRIGFLKTIEHIDCYKTAIVLATPFNKCLEQNKNRKRIVPEDVIERMYKSFNIPFMYEGWDDIVFRYSFEDDSHSLVNYMNMWERLKSIQHDSPHHEFTIGKHCEKCGDLSEKIMLKVNDSISSTISLAAYAHDVGKEFTKSFINSKGETTNIAHYYNHENVGAYEIMLYLLYRMSEENNLDKSDLLEVLQLISLHMRPYNMKTDKSKDKFINLVGQEFYDKLMILHEADKLAH